MHGHLDLLHGFAGSFSLIGLILEKQEMPSTKQQRKLKKIRYVLNLCFGFLSLSFYQTFLNITTCFAGEAMDIS